MQGRRPFFISLVDIIFKKISSQKKNVCFSHPIPPFFFNTRYVSLQIQHIGMYVPSRAALIGVLKKDGTLSLSLSLSRSGWFHDEIAKKADKTPKKKPLARSLPPLDMDVNLLLSQLLD